MGFASILVTRNSAVTMFENEPRTVRNSARKASLPRAASLANLLQRTSSVLSERTIRESTGRREHPKKSVARASPNAFIFEGEFNQLELHRARISAIWS